MEPFLHVWTVGNSSRPSFSGATSVNPKPAFFALGRAPTNVATEPDIEPVKPVGATADTVLIELGNLIATFVVGDPEQPWEMKKVTVAFAPGLTDAGVV